MTDNHDPNDLSWLNDPNNGSADDDFKSLFDDPPTPDWELPDIDMSTPLGGATPNETDDFDSLFNEASSLDSGADAPGLITDQIPEWLQASAPSGATQDLPQIEDLTPLGQPATTDTEGIPSWLDTQEMEAAPVANKEDVPPWLAEADETSERAMAEAESSAQPEVAPGDEDSFLPPWLQDADDLGAAEANAFKASFDDLEFEVETPAENSGVTDPFGGAFDAAPSTSAAVFGEDMPAWMQTTEQPGLPQSDLDALLMDMPSIPGETTDPLLTNLLQGGGSDSVDIDLLSLLEQTESGGMTVQTGMLTPFEERTSPPARVDTSDLPDFAALMAQPEPTPYHPILDEPATTPDPDIDFSTLFGDTPAPAETTEPATPDLDFAALINEPHPAPTDFDFAPPEDVVAPPPPRMVKPPSLPTPQPAANDFDFSMFDDLPAVSASNTDVAGLGAPPPSKPAKPALDSDSDFDSFLTSLQGDDFDFDSPAMESGSLNVAALLNNPSFDDLGDIPAPATSTQDTPVIPDFLRDVSVREASVAAMLRQQQDVPLEDLPEELRALHEELAAIPQSSASSSAIPLLPVIPTTTDLPRTPPGLTDIQRRNAEALRTLAGVSAVSTEAVDVAVQATQKRTQRRRLGINITRLLVAASLTAAVVAPFLVDHDALKVGVQPPAAFAPLSVGGQAYAFIDSLPAGSMVLVSADYSPGGIGEVDELTTPLLRHLFIRGVKPVIIGNDPVTLQHVGRLADSIAQGGQRNRDYVVGRYLLGEAVGTQDFAQNLGSLLETDLNGQPTGLNITSFAQFAGVIVLTDRADSVRVWAEQVAPTTRVPFTFAVGAGAAPLSAPYATDGRFLIGLRDGMTYTRQLNMQYPPDTFVLPTQPPATPSPQPATPEPTDLITVEPTIEATIEATTDGTQTAIPTTEASPTNDDIAQTATLGITPTPTAELTVTVAATNTPSATETPAPTAEPTETLEGGSSIATPGPTLSFEIFAVITGTDRVNVRQGAGTSFPVILSVSPGERFRVISGSSDGQWLQIELPNDRTGWVSASRIQLEQNESGLPAGMRVGASGLLQPVPSSEETSPERRWYAISLGAVVAAILMAMGSFIGVIQIILRRRR